MTAEAVLGAERGCILEGGRRRWLGFGRRVQRGGKGSVVVVAQVLGG